MDCLLQYAKVLEWDADPDSAVDALTAADEILTERLGRFGKCLHHASNVGVFLFHACVVWAAFGSICPHCDACQRTRVHTLSLPVSTLASLASYRFVLTLLVPTLILRFAVVWFDGRYLSGSCLIGC